MTDAIKLSLTNGPDPTDFVLCGTTVTKGTADPAALGSRLGTLCLGSMTDRQQIAAAQARLAGTVAVVEVCPAPGKDPAADAACAFVWNHLRIRT